MNDNHSHREHLLQKVNNTERRVNEIDPPAQHSDKTRERESFLCSEYLRVCYLITINQPRLLQP
jgi:hypothetical protein